MHRSWPVNISKFKYVHPQCLVPLDARVNSDPPGNLLVHQLSWDSKFTKASGESLKGAKMTVRDIREFRDINGPYPYIEI